MRGGDFVGTRARFSDKPAPEGKLGEMFVRVDIYLDDNNTIEQFCRRSYVKTEKQFEKFADARPRTRSESELFVSIREQLQNEELTESRGKEAGVGKPPASDAPGAKVPPTIHKTPDRVPPCNSNYPVSPGFNCYPVSTDHQFLHHSDSPAVNIPTQSIPVAEDKRQASRPCEAPGNRRANVYEEAARPSPQTIQGVSVFPDPFQNNSGIFSLLPNDQTAPDILQSHGAPMRGGGVLPHFNHPKPPTGAINLPAFGYISDEYERFKNTKSRDLLNTQVLADALQNF